MSTALQVCLYNVEPASAEELQSKITTLNFVRLASHYDDPDDLLDALGHGDIRVVFFHLDPAPEAVLGLIEETAERFPDVALVALSHHVGPQAILAPIRAGCDQFVCEPIDLDDLATAVNRITTKRFLRRGSSRCICVGGASGGAGATSVACNLAMEIAKLTEKTCGLVDLNLQFGDMAISLDCEPTYTLFDLAHAGHDLDRTILDKVLTDLPGNVALLARPTHFDQSHSITPEVVHCALELLSATHENVVIDLPRQIDQCGLTALSRADIVLITCQLFVPSIRNTKRYLDALTKAGIPEERIEVVVNRSDSSGGRITTKDLEQLIRKPVYAIIPNDYHYVARSLDFGQPIASGDSNNPIRHAMRSMALKILGESDAKADKRGFLKRLLSK